MAIVKCGCNQSFKKTTALMDQPAGVVRTGRRGEEEAGELGTDGSHGGVDVHAPMPGLLGRTRCVDVKVVEGATERACACVAESWQWFSRTESEVCETVLQTTRNGSCVLWGRARTRLPVGGWSSAGTAGATSAENGAFHWDRVQRTPKE